MEKSFITSGPYSYSKHGIHRSDCAIMLSDKTWGEGGEVFGGKGDQFSI